MKKLPGTLFVLILVLMVSNAALASTPAVESSMETTYARHFTLDYCEGGYQLISIINNKNDVVQRFLTIPEGAEKPVDLAAFLERSEMLSEFKAVKNGNVWCTTPDYFQISNTLGEMVADMNRMLVNDDPTVTAFTYLFRLQ